MWWNVPTRFVIWFLQLCLTITCSPLRACLEFHIMHYSLPVLLFVHSSSRVSRYKTARQMTHQRQSARQNFNLNYYYYYYWLFFFLFLVYTPNNKLPSIFFYGMTFMFKKIMPKCTQICNSLPFLLFFLLPKVIFSDTVFSPINQITH